MMVDMMDDVMADMMDDMTADVMDDMMADVMDFFPRLHIYVVNTR